jgi:hypothetical protein
MQIWNERIAEKALDGTIYLHLLLLLLQICNVKAKLKITELKFESYVFARVILIAINVLKIAAVGPFLPNFLNRTSN